MELDPSTYDGLVGVYRLGPTFQLAVTRDGTRLYSAVSDVSKDELFAESDTEFFYKVADAKIRDREDRASRLILHQGGSDTIGVRIESAADDSTAA